MTITGDMVTLWLAIIAPIMGAVAFLWRELVGLRKDIAAAVTHDTCEKRREKCPCNAEIERIKENLDNPKPKRRKRK
jgi:hypothetical protein